MTNEKLQKIAKQNKINLEYYDEVISFINQNYTYILITFAARENIGGESRHCGTTTIKISVAAVMKREEDETEYTTNGWEWLSDIKAKSIN